jgi:hypothetical protein
VIGRRAKGEGVRRKLRSFAARSTEFSVCAPGQRSVGYTSAGATTRAGRCCLHARIWEDPMDDATFDSLTRRVETLASRRTTLGALVGASLVAALGGSRLDVAAKGKKKCKPKPLAKICRGKCGRVTNNCKKRVDCGPCTCKPACPSCLRCNSAVGVCERDPNQQGDPCGETGQICLGDGSCACDAGSCGGGKVCLGETCVACGFPGAPCCSSNNCPQAGTGCFAGICEACGGTNEQCCPNALCDTGRVCLSGTCEDCGTEGQPCCTGNACSLGTTCANGQCVV